MPQAILAGIDSNEFFDMTPNIIKLCIEKYWENKEREVEWLQFHAWQTGEYVMAAIGAIFSKHTKYPENPLKPKIIIDDTKKYTEEEKEYHRKEFVKRLQRMEKRFNQNKEKEKVYNEIMSSQESKQGL